MASGQGGGAVAIWVSAPGNGYDSWDWLGTLWFIPVYWSTYYVPSTGHTVLNWLGKAVGEESQGSQVFGLHSWANGRDMQRREQWRGRAGLGGERGLCEMFLGHPV